LPYFIRVSDLLLWDDGGDWRVRGDWVVNYSPKELMALGCDFEDAVEISRCMARDSAQQYRSLQRYRRFRYTDDDVEEALPFGQHPFLAEGCRWRRRLR
jgi:hypothetical protein